MMMTPLPRGRSARSTSCAALMAAAVATTGLVATACHRAPARPNVILIVVDSLRADALGCYGAERSVSPNIDRMAANGLRCERAIAQAPWNLPSISSLVTATYPSQHGQGASVGAAGTTATLAEVLAANGYRTAAFSEVAWPLLQRGFQTFENTAAPHLYGDPSKSSADKTFAAAADWVRAGQPAPFFLFIHTYEVQSYFMGKPHAQDLARRENPSYKGRFLDWGIRDTQTPVGPRLVDALLGANADDLRYVDSLYRGGIAAVDTAVGRLLDVIKQRQLDSNTLVILTSSNGEAFRPDLKRVYHGGRLHDDQLHVPVVVVWPGRIAPGTVKTLVESIDIAPTVLVAASLAPEARFRGTSFLAGETGFLARLRSPRFVPNADPAKTAFAEESAMRVDAQGRIQASTTRQTVLYSEWAALIDTGQGLELYDLKADPAEERNLATARADVAAALRTALAQRAGESASAKDAGSDVNEQLRSLGYVQ